MPKSFRGLLGYDSVTMLEMRSEQGIIAPSRFISPLAAGREPGARLDNRMEDRTRKDRFDACRLLVSDCDVILKLSSLAPPTCNFKKNNQAKRNASRGRSIHQCKSRKPPASAGAVHHRSEGNDFRYASTASVLRRPRLLGLTQ